MKKAKLLRVWRMLNRIGAILFGMIYLGCLLFWEVNPTFCYSTVSSGSMAPNINAGDCVIWDYRPVSQDEIKVGDICIYKNQTTDKHVIHRITAIYGDDIIFKGDANDVADPMPVHIEQVEGLYIGTTTYDSILILAQSDVGKIMAFILFAAFIAIEMAICTMLKETA